MDPNPIPHLHLWCPRPFGTYTQNNPCPQSGATKPPFPRLPSPPRTENTPPVPPDVPDVPAAPPDDGRVLLDTWYVIKPGNTKEKVAFFVAHQCGAARAATGKAKGNWAGHSSKAKRRRRCHDPAKGDPSGDTNADSGDGADLLSVAEMVALVERRAALALQGFPRPCGAVPDATDAKPGGGGGGGDCSRVAEAVAQFESRHRRGDTDATARPNGLRPAGGERGAGAQPGEVRIAFRIAGAAEPGAAAGRPSCVVMSRGVVSATKDKITCDLYRLINPARGALPNNMEALLAGAKGGDGGDAMEPNAANADASDAAGVPHCAAGFHVDVVVTGVVDQCVFFGKDSAKKVTEETVRLPNQDDPPTPPPPGQLFGIGAAAEAPVEAADERGGAADDPSLCRLYRHVSHDFLEIRFKIQRLLEPRQYMLLLPEHVMVKIFGYLPTRALAALKCCCHYFKSIIETFGVRGADSRWSRHPLYRDDPCKQCKKRYERGDVSLCRWHPKPYHHDLPYGRSYWMCCRRGDKDAPGCRVGLHDNNWVHQEGRREEGR
ncbi:F-box only protein 46 [Patagioenas fasciata]|uniref:F-box only protein 46 n=1 Tax=Patagioenas fasciata TaxID=372321 RepID=UPI0032E87A24